MKITLALVMSLDGRTTKGKNPGTSPWASQEDQALFQELIASHERIVMGSATYKAVRSTLKPSAAKPRLVLTRKPQQFAQDVHPGLDFSAEEPKELVDRLACEGCNTLLLVGGAETNARFLDAQLVDELFVTIEPVLFGAGLPFANSISKALGLRLIGCRQLNSQGTVLAHYSITYVTKEYSL